MEQNQLFMLEYEECTAHETLLLLPGLFTLAPTSFLDIGPVIWCPLATLDCQKEEVKTFTIELNLKAELFQCAWVDDKKAEGILYWLGTNRGTSPTYTSPIDTTVVAALSSTTYATAINAFARPIQSEGRVSCYIAAAETIKTMALDFGTLKVCPTQYTCRSDSNDNYSMRNWALEGSNDGKVWVMLDNRVNDISMAASNGLATYTIAPVTETAYRHLRLNNTGANSRGDTNFMINGFEVYGSVMENDA